MKSLCQIKRSQLYPLRKITLEALSGGYDRDDLWGLWNAIFSLPQLDQLKVVIEKGFTTNVTREPQLKDCHIVNESWERGGSGKCVNTTKE